MKNYQKISLAFLCLTFVFAVVVAVTSIAQTSDLTDVSQNVPADYDNDGVDDIAVYRPSN